MILSKSYIILNKLRFHAYHGVMEQERSVGNDYTVSLRVECDTQKASSSDNVDDTLNYADVYDVVNEVMNVPAALIEKVASDIVSALFERFKEISSIRISLLKNNPPMGADCEGAGVELHYLR